MQKYYKREKEALTERSEKEGTRICVTWKQRAVGGRKGTQHRVESEGESDKNSVWRCHNETYVQYTPTLNALKIIPH